MRVTPTYRNYLESFGTPTQLAKVIMLSDEKIAIVDHGNSSFSFETVSGNCDDCFADMFVS